MTYTCFEHQEVHPWQVVGFHSPFKVYEPLPVSAKALNAGFSAAPSVTAAPAAAAVFTKFRRVNPFEFMGILFLLL
jgi:hypothetical protein